MQRPSANNIQSMINSYANAWQAERAETQMTLGKLIKTLENEKLPGETIITGLGELRSYRGYYIDLAFEPSIVKQTVDNLLDKCRMSMGKIFEGFKGGEYMMGETTPLWVAEYGCSGERLMSISADGIVTAPDK